MISDAGVVAMPLCIPTAQGLLGCMAPELIFPLQAQREAHMKTASHCCPLTCRASPCLDDFSDSLRTKFGEEGRIMPSLAWEALLNHHQKWPDCYEQGEAHFEEA